MWSALSDFIAEFIKMKVLTFPFNLTARRCLLRGVSGEYWEEVARQQQAEGGRTEKAALAGGWELNRIWWKPCGQ